MRKLWVWLIIGGFCFSGCTATRVAPPADRAVADAPPAETRVHKGEAERLVTAVEPSPIPADVHEGDMAAGAVDVPAQEEVAEPTEPPAVVLPAEWTDRPGMKPEFLVDPLLPPPTDAAERWPTLDHVVRQQATQFSGRLSVVAIDLHTHEHYEFRPNDRYYPASTYKLPVVLCALEAMEQGELTWDTLIEYTEADYDPVGGGNFYQSRFGERFPVSNLVARMIISSNNIATLMMSRQLGLDNILACTTAMGGPVTRDADGSTPVRATDVAAWWLHFWKRYQEKPETLAEVIEWFRRTDYRGRIMAGTPISNDQILHKFGSYAGNEHDGALVLGERPYILVVLTHGGSGYDWLIQEIARAAYTDIASRADENPANAPSVMSGLFLRV